MDNIKTKNVIDGQIEKISSISFVINLYSYISGYLAKNNLSFSALKIKDFKKLSSEYFCHHIIEDFKYSSYTSFLSNEELNNEINEEGYRKGYINFTVDENSLPKSFNLIAGQKFNANLIKYKRDYGTYHFTDEERNRINELTPISASMVYNINKIINENLDYLETNDYEIEAIKYLEESGKVLNFSDLPIKASYNFYKDDYIDPFAKRLYKDLHKYYNIFDKDYIKIEEDKFTKVDNEGIYVNNKLLSQINLYMGNRKFSINLNEEQSKRMKGAIEKFNHKYLVPSLDYQLEKQKKRLEEENKVLKQIKEMFIDLSKIEDKDLQKKLCKELLYFINKNNVPKSYIDKIPNQILEEIKNEEIIIWNKKDKFKNRRKAFAFLFYIVLNLKIKQIDT